MPCMVRQFHYVDCSIHQYLVYFYGICESFNHFSSCSYNFFSFFLFLAKSGNFMFLILILSDDNELNPGPATHYIKKNCRKLYCIIQSLRPNFLYIQSHACNYEMIIL